VAAEAVQAAFERVAPRRFTVDLEDPMSREAGILARRLTAVYGPITRHAPALWALGYHVTNAAPTVRTIQGTLGRGLRPRMRQLLDPPPALVASFHPLLNHVALDVLPKAVPLVTVITDWIDFHHAWTDRRASFVICPSEPAMVLCRQRGIPEARLFRAGLPVHPRFADAMRRYPDRRSARQALRLRPYAPTVLLVGGGDGTEPLDRYARALAALPLDLQVLAVCGRNERLARRLREESHAGVHVFGFVDNMPELMLASDLVVTRAGPGMIAEALACGCPLLLTARLPGQETGNVREVLRLRVGQFVPRISQLVEAVRAWYAKPEPEREADRRRAKAAMDPQAAFKIARFLARVARKSVVSPPSRKA
jgi:1,2-diacylglycerol 3-beta-galactosyltransferase